VVPASIVSKITFSGTEVDIPCFQETTINTEREKRWLRGTTSGGGRLSQRNVVPVVSWPQFGPSSLMTV
jgi:hypothetical protein